MFARGSENGYNSVKMRVLALSERIGQIAVLEFEKEAVKRGFIVSYPSVSATRYDAVLDYCNGKSPIRVQIKHGGNLSDAGSIKLNLRRRKKNYTSKQIDLIVVFIPFDYNKLVALPPHLFNNKNSLIIRFDKSMRYDKTPAILADNYLF